MQINLGTPFVTPNVSKRPSPAAPSETAASVFADMIARASAEAAASTPRQQVAPGVQVTIDDAFKSADADGSGKLTKDEFVKFDDLMRPNGQGRLVEVATGRVVDGNYMFPLIDRLNVGFVTLDQVKWHYSEPGKYNGFA